MDEFIRLLETVFEVFEFGQSPQAFLVLVGLAFARLLAFLVVKTVAVSALSYLMRVLRISPQTTTV